MTIIIKPYYSQVETPTVRGPILYSQEDPSARAIQGFGRGVTALTEKLRQRLEQKKRKKRSARSPDGPARPPRARPSFSRASWPNPAARPKAPTSAGRTSTSG